MAGEEGTGGYYALCAVRASWAVLTLVVGYDVAFLGEEGAASAFDGGGANDVPPAEQTGPPNNGAAGLLRVDDAPVPAAARRGNDRVVVPRARAPFDAVPSRSGGDRARVRGILRRRGRGGRVRGERGLRGVGGAVRLRLPPGDGGAAGRVGAVAVRRRGGRRGGSLGAGAGDRRRGKVEGGSGSAAVLAGRRWRGGMTMAAGVPLRCWGGGGTVGA